MTAVVDLFTTPYGLFSLATIVGVIAMAIWFYRFFKRKVEESDADQRNS
ncbi:DUF3149 domain-containing protein [Hydrogenophaga sp.]|nr:DUF3149 domain-containing protein [Hydrogenophaga sp.]MBD3892433.1 DUF3149 domain-containing protein [Hydrogenophaga sp.]